METLNYIADFLAARPPLLFSLLLALFLVISALEYWRIWRQGMEKLSSPVLNRKKRKQVSSAPGAN